MLRGVCTQLTVSRFSFYCHQCDRPAEQESHAQAECGGQRGVERAASDGVPSGTPSVGPVVPRKDTDTKVHNFTMGVLLGLIGMFLIFAAGFWYYICGENEKRLQHENK